MKAVIFDMFETLATLYEGPIYFGRQIAQDLKIPEDRFQELWKRMEDDRSIGRITLEEALSEIMRKNGRYSKEALDFVVEKRKESREKCFLHLHKEIIPMLRLLKARTVKIGLISNCYSEEVDAIKNSVLFPYFDAVFLSFEQRMAKPDKEIFYRCIDELQVNAEDCLYVGDGGSQELETARDLGMKAIQAVWYFKEGTVQTVGKKYSFPQAETPLDIIYYL